MNTNKNTSIIAKTDFIPLPKPTNPVWFKNTADLIEYLKERGARGFTLHNYKMRAQNGDFDVTPNGFIELFQWNHDLRSYDFVTRVGVTAVGIDDKGRDFIKGIDEFTDKEEVYLVGGCGYAVNVEYAKQTKN